jgi:hypothetical protein
LSTTCRARQAVPCPPDSRIGTVPASPNAASTSSGTLSKRPAPVTQATITTTRPRGQQVFRLPKRRPERRFNQPAPHPDRPGSDDQRQAAEPDAGHDGHAAGGLRDANWVPERHRARDGADQRLEVEEPAGDLGGDLALPECEQGERQQRAARGQREDHQHRASATRHGWWALGEGSDRQRAERGAEELHGGDRDRVAAGQQTALGHGDRGRQDE